MNWKNFLKPSISKIIISLLTALSYYGIRFALSLLIGRLEPEAAILFLIPSFILWIVHLLVLMLLYYPFACAISAIWIQRKEKGIFDSLKELKILIGLLLFNPVVSTVILAFIWSFLIVFKFYILQYPPINCGIIVDNVTSNSPADMAGIQPGMILMKADGKNIETLEDFQNLVKLKKPGDTLNVTLYSDESILSRQELTILLGKNPSENVTDPYIGFLIGQHTVITDCFIP